MTTRREARRIALDILYQADVTGEDPLETMRGWERAGRVIPAFTRTLVDGVARFQPDIDLLLEERSADWTVARMASVDRTILRLAVYELRHGRDVPASVAISEAVEAASELSSDEAKSFVNGILGSIAREPA